MIPVGKEGALVPVYTDSLGNMKPLFPSGAEIKITDKYIPDENLVTCKQRTVAKLNFIILSITAKKQGETMVQAEVYLKGETEELVVRRTFKVEVVDYSEYTDLSAKETANCYLVSKEGKYCFNAQVKGPGTDPVEGSIASAEVLWESFGTSDIPSKGDVIYSASYSNGKVLFSTPQTLKNGNAVIVVMDEMSNILWSWHIWVCKDYDPETTEQIYYNDAGTFMDRNLGATSADKGDICALGLLYQWGRKDPFPGCSAQTGYKSPIAATTLSSWPEAVMSDATFGTVAYAVAHPTTFIKQNANNEDWLFAETKTSDNTRWRESVEEKGAYDPCPTGWRVPDGGLNKAWALALGSNKVIMGETYSKDKLGYDFAATEHKLGASSCIWYPFNGYIDGNTGILQGTNFNFLIYSSSPNHNSIPAVFEFCANSNGYVYPATNAGGRGYGLAVRCVKD